MVSIDKVKTIVDDLSRSQASAYSSGVDFNNHSRLAESYLLDYYLSTVDIGSSQEALSPFVAKSNEGSPAGIFSLPTNLRRLSFVEAREVSVVDGKAVITTHPCHFRTGVEVSESRKSAIRSGNRAKGRYIYFQEQGQTFKVEPLVPSVAVNYYREPIFAVWGYTVDGTNVVENYDTTATTDYEWRASDERNLIDILLYLRGIVTGQPELIEWLSQKKVSPSILK